MVCGGSDCHGRFRNLGWHTERDSRQRGLATGPPQTFTTGEAMSLDVYLEIHGAKRESVGTGIFVRENGSTREITREEWDADHPGMEPVTFTPEDGSSPVVYSANITHNLNEMADAAGIYKYLWRPEEVGVATAEQLINPLSYGLALLESDPDQFMAFNPLNGWGSYEGLVKFVRDYITACRKYPTATVKVWR